MRLMEEMNLQGGSRADSVGLAAVDDFRSLWAVGGDGRNDRSSIGNRRCSSPVSLQITCQLVYSTRSPSSGQASQLLPAVYKVSIREILKRSER